MEAEVVIAKKNKQNVIFYDKIMIILSKHINNTLEKSKRCFENYHFYRLLNLLILLADVLTL